MKNDRVKELLIRSASGLVLAAVTFVLTTWSLWSFGAFLLLVLIPAMAEYYRLARLSGSSPATVSGIVTGVLLLWCNLMFALNLNGLYLDRVAGRLLILFPLVLLTVMPSMIFVCEIFRRRPNPIGNMATTLTGLIYVAVPLSMMCYVPLLLGEGEWRPFLILLYIGILWANDVFAYIIGTAFGRHRLCERISPKKSWEGFFGGIAGAVIVAAVGSYGCGQNIAWWCGLAVVASLAGAAGDLVESMMKRQAGVKDSGAVLPGHGGILDRFDAFLMAAPFVFVYLLLKIGM